MKKEELPEVQPETESGVEPDREDAPTRRKRQAGQVLQKHFMAHPDGVIIATISGNKIEADVTEFKDLGALLFARHLLNKYVDEAIDTYLLNQKENMAAAAAKKGPQAAQPESGAV